MARIITECFEGAHLLRFGNPLGLNGNPTVVTTASIGMAMDGVYCLDTGSFDGSMSMPMPDIAPTSLELYVGFFFIATDPDKFYSAIIGGSGFTDNHRLISFWSGLTGLCTIKINPQTQIIEAWLGGHYYIDTQFNIEGNPLTFLAASTQAQPISGNTLYHLQVHVKVNGAASLIEVKLDDTLVISAVCNLGASPIDHFVWHSAGTTYADSAGGSFQYYDDIVVNDTTTVADNSWTGVRRFVVQNVTGPGTYAQFTPVGDAPNFRCIDDLPNDGDATYNYSINSGFKDSFPVSPHGLDLAHTTFHAFFEEAIARKTAGTMKINLGVRRAGVDYYSAVSHDLGVSYDVFDNRLSTDPSSLTFWTGLGLDSTEIIYRAI